MNKIIISSIILLFASGITGCASKSKEQVFQNTMRAYERVFRWGDIAKTNNFRKVPVSFTENDRNAFKSIKITGYEIQNVKSEDELTMEVTVQIRYYNNQYMRVKNITDTQKWQYDKEKQLWFLNSPLPQF